MEKQANINELGDIVVNGECSIQELYNYAKENGFENHKLYFIGKEEGKISDIFTTKVTTFGKGWIKDTAILKIEYKKEIDTGFSCDK